MVTNICHGIKLVQEMNFCPRLAKIGILPPPFRVGNHGRPSNHDRRKGLNESSSTKYKLSREKHIISCSKGREEGHKNSTFSNERVENVPKG